MRLLASLEASALIPSDAVMVLLVGSRALGWEHERSDLDVVVVTVEPWSAPIMDRQKVALTEGSIGLVVTSVDGVPCEVKYWTGSQIQELLGKVSWAAWEAGDTGESLSTNESLLIERLPDSVALSGDVRWADTAGQVRAGAARSQSALACLTRADDSLDDVSGLAGSDIRGAVLAAQRAFVHVTDALTASLGRPGTDSKWRLRRVEAVDSEVLSPEEFWRVVTMQDFDPHRPEVWVDSVMFRCSQIMLDVRLGR